MSSHHEIIQDLANQLEEWDYRIDRLEHRIKALPQELSDEIKNKVVKLKNQRASLILKMKDVEESIGSAVDHLEQASQETVKAMHLLFEDIQVDVKVEFS